MYSQKTQNDDLGVLNELLSSRSMLYFSYIYLQCNIETFNSIERTLRLCMLRSEIFSVEVSARTSRPAAVTLSNANMVSGRLRILRSLHAPSPDSLQTHKQRENII